MDDIVVDRSAIFKDDGTNRGRPPPFPEFLVALTRNAKCVECGEPALNELASNPTPRFDQRHPLPLTGRSDRRHHALRCGSVHDQVRSRSARPGQPGPRSEEGRQQDAQTDPQPDPLPPNRPAAPGPAGWQGQSRPEMALMTGI